MKNLIKALAEFRDDVPVIHQETQGYNYTYASLGKIIETINPLLRIHGLGYTQLLDGSSLKTIIYHIETGESMESSVALPVDTLKGMNAYQSAGSAITYFRRYSISCAFGLITDKDIDAAGSSLPKIADFDKVKEAVRTGTVSIAKLLTLNTVTNEQLNELKAL